MSLNKIFHYLGTRVWSD